MTVESTELIQFNAPSVQLSAQFKDGKTAITATVTESTPEGAKALLDHVKALYLGAPVPASSTADSNSDAQASARPTAAKTPGKREQKKNAEMLAREANENALKWARRAIIAIPEFNGLTPQELAEKLKMKKPLAGMAAEESWEFIKLLSDALTMYGAQHADVNGYLVILQAIDKLQTGTDEEWAEAKQSIKPDHWTFAQMNGTHLVQAAKAELDAKQKMLRVAADFAASQASPYIDAR